MKKKWLVRLLSLACVAAGSLGLVACGGNSTQNSDESTEIEAVYAQYVVYAEAQGQAPLSYEDWLATIKGEKGDKGEDGVGIKSVQIDADGNLLITFTDGTSQTVEMPKQDGTQQAVQSLQYQRIAGKDEYRVIGLGNVAELDIVIPDTYNGLPVTEIGTGAFLDDIDPRVSYLTSVVIPDSVTSIGDGAFRGCSSLTSITIPDSVTSIGPTAFSYCDSLTSVVIPDSVTSIANSAFSRCSSLTSITIPDSVTSIGNHAFSGCSSLTSITIPDSVTSIGDDAFTECCGLTSVVIGNSVTSIGDSAFAGCSGLTSITIPEGVTSIGEQAFAGCSALTSITISDSVTSIGDYAFASCSALTSITIPEGVNSIGVYAFRDCYNLKIYCEAESQPNGWSYIWSFPGCTVVWGYTGD